jgi:hypothetical protein
MEHIDFLIYKAIALIAAAFLYGVFRGWRGF